MWLGIFLLNAVQVLFTVQHWRISSVAPNRVNQLFPKGNEFIIGRALVYLVLFRAYTKMDHRSLLKITNSVFTCCPIQTTSVKQQCHHQASFFNAVFDFFRDFRLGLRRGLEMCGCIKRPDYLFLNMLKIT